MKKEKHKSNIMKLNSLYNIVSTLRLLIVCSIIVSLFFTFIARKEVVRGTSMYPTLKDNQTVFMNVIGSYTTQIKRFDIVVAKNYTTDTLWVKRVIGLPNETIEYRDDILYINGKATTEPFLSKRYVEDVKTKRNLISFTKDYKSRKLGKDEYLLVGDNRNDSLDSRNSEVGAFTREQIIAKGLLIVSPIKEMRYIRNGGE